MGVYGSGKKSDYKNSRLWQKNDPRPVCSFFIRPNGRILYRASAGSEADGSAELARLGPSAILGKSNA